jgi:FkbH-like protein
LVLRKRRAEQLRTERMTALAPLAIESPEPFSSEASFRVPADLSVTPTDLRRILVVGSCLSEWLTVKVPEWAPNCQTDFLLFNHFAELPVSPPRPIQEYDFQLVQLPLRFIMEETIYFRLPWSDTGAWENFFSRSCEVLRNNLSSALRYADDHGLLTFVANFLTPQQNPMGRMLPRNDLRNLVYFVDRLNRELSEFVEQSLEVYVLDVDQIAADCGRRYIQDDLLAHTSHGALLDSNAHELDSARIEPPGPLGDLYSVQTETFMREMWAETVALYRTARQIDQVKLVVVDLDDTLWRGVIAEADEITEEATEGWPLGLAEALSFLRKRGILLAIVSKNDENRIEAIWPPNLRKCLSLADFAIRRINWRPKVENLEAILAELNLLPRSVVYVDDSPVERAAVKAAFPEIRVLGSSLYSIRRVLLWSAETQVPTITEESDRRTEMIQAQSQREALRSQVTREDFLAQLNVGVEVAEIKDTANRRTARALELINKSNQFNTTGERRTIKSLRRLFDAGGYLITFVVEDRYTSYGIVGVVVLEPSPNGVRVAQFVMSCRVFGLDVEIAVLAEVVRRSKAAGHNRMTATFVPTDANGPARTLFPMAGFIEGRPGAWELDCEEFETPVPAHVSLS